MVTQSMWFGVENPTTRPDRKNDRYVAGVPADFRAAKPYSFLKPEQITDDKLTKIHRLQECADRRGQTLAQMAIAWVLRHKEVTSALIGASRPAQIEDAIGALANRTFTSEELQTIDEILA